LNAIFWQVPHRGKDGFQIGFTATGNATALPQGEKQLERWTNEMSLEGMV